MKDKKKRSVSLVERTLSELRSFGVGSDGMLLLGVSGGPDSLALLHVLHTLRNTHRIRDVIAVHINHTLRGPASDNDERLVRHFTHEWTIPLEVLRTNTRAESVTQKKGVEETAREIRYAYFLQVAQRHQCRYVITAHTANDQAETVLMNLVRGTGVRGLSGIPAKRELKGTSDTTNMMESVTVLRPWLEVSREEIDGYLKEHSIGAAEDESNASLDYQRNRVRNIVVPALIEAYPQRAPIQTIGTFAHRIAELNSFLSELTAEKLRNVLSANHTIPIAELRNMNGYLLYALLEAWIDHVDENYRFTNDEVDCIRALLTSDQGRLQLRRGLSLAIVHGHLTIVREHDLSFEPRTIEVGGSVDTPQGTLALREYHGSTVTRERYTACFDSTLLNRSHLFTVRAWQAGDKMQPFGMSGHKHVSDILNEAGIIGAEKEDYPVVVTDTDEIVWIPGVRRASGWEVTIATISVVIFEWKSKIK